MWNTIRRPMSGLSVLVLAGSAAAAEPPTDAELIELVDTMAAEALDRPGAVGLSIAVARGGSVVLEKAYGLAEVEHGVPADAETMFRIGSVTKQYTAAAIMKLVEDGKLTLDETVEGYFPDYPLEGRAVTIRHLLTHTSGIPSYTSIDEFWETGVSRELTVEELLAYVEDEPFDFEPGEQWSYNNTAYYMLGPIIEEASGKTYPDYLQETFFEPLGLDRTRYDSNRDIMMNRAQGYDFDREAEVLRNDGLIGMANPGAAGALVSTAGDLVRWGMALSDGRVVSTESYQQMITPYELPDGEDTGYGFGLGVRDQHDRACVSHGGGIFGFNSMLTHFPEDDLYVAVISNGRANSGRLCNRIAGAALGIEEEPVADLDVAPELAARLAGLYTFADAGLDLETRISIEDGRLTAAPAGQGTFRLLYQGDLEFRASFDNSVIVAFDDSDDDAPAPGFTLFQGGNVLHADRIEDTEPEEP